MKLPKKLANSKYILNIQNKNDERCALWCIIAHLFPKYHCNQTNNKGELNQREWKINAYKQHEKDINTTGIDFPLKISDVDKLEFLNDLNINIFSVDSNSNIIPIRISNREIINKQRIIDLLYIANGAQSHYCLITNLASLCRAQVTKRYRSSNFLCRRCLHFCANKKSYGNHMALC